MAVQIIPPLISAIGKIGAVLVASGLGKFVADAWSKKSTKSTQTEYTREEIEALKRENEELRTELQTQKWRAFFKSLKGKPDAEVIGQMVREQTDGLRKELYEYKSFTSQRIDSLVQQINTQTTHYKTKGSNTLFWMSIVAIVVCLIMTTIAVVTLFKMNVK
ncbi:hypothetical protein EIN_031870 [Entamoeba invadens IP1]|uniref:Uncharacterized protein n=1 Tax=Entamoeba invadens IP1 TaxID=370355 RepID=A0A0A1U433_ENTIV|nr:hypothetical protein EIN_031870 [Entamoeba invadens IP1]ELP86446.1 hypothetical protein EIN_031870 [Entamoeba invadens IP1]|eukprot:XP_004185792.1 hypothetical protein EIN_031870 [Entamoeba invadens IP1]